MALSDVQAEQLESMVKSGTKPADIREHFLKNYNIDVPGWKISKMRKELLKKSPGRKPKGKEAPENDFSEIENEIRDAEKGQFLKMTGKYKRIKGSAEPGPGGEGPRRVVEGPCDIVRLYLEKLEQLTMEERGVLIAILRAGSTPLIVGEGRDINEKDVG